MIDIDIDIDIMGTDNRLEYEETELRLGPGGGNNYLKRGFSQTIDLKLNLNASSSSMASSSSSPRHDVENQHHQDINVKVEEEKSTAKPPAAKAQVIGWPPVRSLRKKMVSCSGGYPNGGDGALVKVSVDGAPYLRKVDLKMYKSYQQLSDALGKMFAIGNCGCEGLKDFMGSETKLIDLLNGSDYVPTYQDKDGDWMLVGDVPWQIMKSSEAIGLAPRAVEKCKNRV